MDDDDGMSTRERVLIFAFTTVAYFFAMGLPWVFMS